VSPTPTTSATLEASSEPSEPTFEPTVEVPPEPTVAAPAFAPIKLSGTTNKVAKFRIPENEVAIVNFTYKGSSNFAVWSIEADGSRSELLVNTIGRYNGTTMFGVTDHPVAFKIEGRGAWTATIKPILSAPRWDPATPLTGRGDKVYLVVPPSSGIVTVSARYRGDDNFAVWAYNPSTVRELLVNEIGNYQGEELLPDGTVILHVDADTGSWSFTPT
jgi:hypothetical protein